MIVNRRSREGGSHTVLIVCGNSFTKGQVQHGAGSKGPHSWNPESASHQGTTFPSQSRKAPVSFSEMEDSTFSIPCTLSSTVRGGCGAEREMALCSGVFPETHHCSGQEAFPVLISLPPVPPGYLARSSHTAQHKTPANSAFLNDDALPNHGQEIPYLV